MAVATFLGVFPSAAILSLTLGRAIQHWPFIFSSLVFNAAMVAVLTWIVMPLVTRALHNWLHANERRTS
jgi:antibiotic biosynthesis monooxygenase (ABM) superfamily enzyme